MPTDPRKRITRLHIAAGFLALAAGGSLLAAYSAHQGGKSAMGYIAQAVIWATVCFMFLRIAARRKRGTFQADGDAPPKNPNDGNA